mgnify:CR=1 FL=1
MLRVGVMVSGGGTNLQAILDAIDSKKIRNAAVAAVISNNRNAYALKRAEENGIPSLCVSPRTMRPERSSMRSFLRRWTDCSRI